MILNLLLLIAINVLIANATILNESLLKQQGFNKTSSNITIDNPTIIEIDTNAFKEFTNITIVKLTLNKISTIDLKVFKSSSFNLISIWISAPSLTKLTSSEKTRFPILQKLELNVSALLSLDSDVINGLPNLTQLSFTNSFQLSPLKPNQLSSLKNLDILRLVVKNQTSLSKSHFNGLTSLRNLVFQSSNIQKIDNDTFNGLNNLEILNLWNNSLNQLDLSHVSGKLTSLMLNLNNLSYLRFPKRLENLLYLDLASNRFRSFKTIDFNAFTNLRTLSLSQNSLDNPNDISTYLKPLVNLTTVYLTNMSISGTIDSSLFKFNSKLQNIDLSNNRIVKLASNAFTNLNITRIYIDKNLLTELDNSVFLGQNLLVLIDLDNNKLTKIGSRIFNNFTRLTLVSLNYNKLSKLDDSTFSGCKNLRYVYLYNNTDLQTSNLQSLCPKEATNCKVHY